MNHTKSTCSKCWSLFELSECPPPKKTKKNLDNGNGFMGREKSEESVGRTSAY